MRMNYAIVKLGIVLNTVIGIGHLLCMMNLESIFAIYGIDGTMALIAQYGTWLPYAITIVIAIAFLLAAAYGLSALRLIPRLPLQHTAFVVMSIVFLGRAVWGITILVSGFSYLELSSTGIALLLGICYLPCLIKHKDNTTKEDILSA